MENKPKFATAECHREQLLLQGCAAVNVGGGLPGAEFDI